MQLKIVSFQTAALQKAEYADFFLFAGDPHRVRLDKCFVCNESFMLYPCFR